MDDFNSWYQHGIDKGWITPVFVTRMMVIHT
jgi:hypothetical protein